MQGDSLQVLRRPFPAGVRILVVAGVVAAFVLGIVGPAAAQSPTPTWYSEDNSPSDNTFPSGANAVVVEGIQVGVGGCPYSLLSTEQETVKWVNANDPTITEVSNYEPCDTSASKALTDYEAAITSITNYVEAHATNPGRYWGGIMLDQESSWGGFSAGNYEAITKYTESAMGNTIGISWVYTEDFTPSGGWSLSQYNAILDQSWPAPQAYNSYMTGSVINPECSTYSVCSNMLTIDSAMAYPWNSPSWVSSQVSGTPWTQATWGSAYWYNLWRGV